MLIPTSAPLSVTHICDFMPSVTLPFFLVLYIIIKTLKLLLHGLGVTLDSDTVGGYDMLNTCVSKCLTRQKRQIALCCVSLGVTENTRNACSKVSV